MPISIMIKPASAACNLKCEYCFYNCVAQSRQEFNKGIMKQETAEKIIKSALDFADDEVVITFQGGEPLLVGIDFYDGFVKLVKKLNKNMVKFSISLQTKATLINEQWCEFFRNNGFLIGVSLDGDRQLNAYRKFADGGEAFDDMLRGIELLKKYKIPFNILSVLSKNIANNFRKTYRFFKSLDLTYLQYIPCLKPFNSDDNEYSMSSADYENYLNSAFKIYYNDVCRGQSISIRQFDNYRLLASNKNAEQCGMNGTCSTQFVVEGDGSVYPCDFYCTDDWLLGNINELSFKQMYNSPKAVEFIKDSFKLREECKECRYFYLCRGGGCKRNREAYDYCTAYKSFFEKNEELILKIRA